MRQLSWDQYEVALFVEAYWKIKDNKSLRRAIISELSATLRSCAKKRDIAINEIYRNKNGISMRLGELEYLFSGDGKGLKNTSDLFRHMVRLYKSDYVEFMKILRKAKDMSCNVENTRQQFCKWLMIKTPKAQPDVTCRLLSIAEEFCLKIKVLYKPLFETTDEATVKRFAKTVRHNKKFRIKNKKCISRIVSASNWYYAFVRALPTISCVETDPVIPPKVGSNLIVDFNGSQSLAFTKPVSLIYCGCRDESVSNWADLYVKFVSNLYEQYLSSIPVGTSFTGSGRVDFGDQEMAKAMSAPKTVDKQMYLETNLSATDIVSKIKALLDICGVDYNDVVITYQKKTQSGKSSDTTQQQRDVAITTGVDRIISFADWLRNVKKMAEGTCRSYESVLNIAEKYAQRHNFSCGKIFGVNRDDALGTVACLMANEDFQRMNQEQHNRFFVVFGKLKEYFEYIDPYKTAPNAVDIYVPPKLSDALSVFLKEHTDGILKNAILEHFPNYSTQQINRALLSCHAVQVLGKYYSKECIYDYVKMADTILNVLLKQFAANGDYTSAQQLYNEARSGLNDFFFYNNAFDSRREVYDLAVHLFTQEKYKRYAFLFSDRKHIWKTEPDYPKDFHGLLIKYGREHYNVFTKEQAIAFFEFIGSKTPDQTLSNVLLNSGSNSFLQYDENCFVLAEALHVNDNFLNALRIQIENLLEGEAYIAFGEINDYFYTTLPAVPANIHWSPLLLGDVLRVFDTGYTTVEAGKRNNKKTIPAAILNTKSQIRTFSDLVWNEISKTYSLPKELAASEFRKFLLDRGFIHGSEKIQSVHKTVSGDSRFFWINNGTVIIN